MALYIWLTSSYCYQIWGVIYNWTCKLAAGKTESEAKRDAAWKMILNPVPANPQLWPACTSSSSSCVCVSVCVCVWPAWVNPYMWMHLSSATTASRFSSLLLQVPLCLKYCLLSFLSACLRWRPQGRNIFQGMYGYTQLLKTSCHLPRHVGHICCFCPIAFLAVCGSLEMVV